MLPPVNAIPSPSNVEIPSGNQLIQAVLEIPPHAKAIIVFAHGKGSNKLSPRNRLVARILLQKGFAVLLPDLTILHEDDDSATAAHDQNQLRQSATRLTAIIDWLAANRKTHSLRVGLFGGRSGAAAVMMAAALKPEKVHAVISRGGRPDLADEFLEDVKAPTLMIAGSRDAKCIEHHRKAAEKMRKRPMLELIPGASHLFCEPGKIEQVASISLLWFQWNLQMEGRIWTSATQRPASAGYVQHVSCAVA